jgi:N6-L-threonylcarbamoyladenine synthase
MGLAYPGGPKIEQLAKKGDGTCFTFPRPLKGKEGCDMSFSGLKTAVRQAIDSVEMNEQNMADIAASFQEAVADVLEEKVAKAMEQAKVETLVVAGGVAANQFLRGKLEILAGQHNMQLIAPPIKLCTDNAAMIAWGGMEHFQLGNINLLTFAPKARWPL